MKTPPRITAPGEPSDDDDRKDMTYIPPPIEDEPFLASADDVRLAALLTEAHGRRNESLRLYEPLPHQQRFHECPTRQRLIRKGNRAGGTTCGAAEIARAATEQDPHGKYPTDRPLVIWVIGYDESHIGRVIYNALFKPGAFKVIKDEKTGQWRAFRPNSEAHREKEAVPAAPLIPDRFYRESDIAWKNKRLNAFGMIRLLNGTEIWAFSGNAEPAQGNQVDLIWVDEDIPDAGWIPELLVRLIDRRGRFIWTAFPHNDNDALTDMSERAEQCAGQENPPVVEFIMSMRDNPFLDNRAREEALSGCHTEEERRAREDGAFITESVLMYPMFHMGTHGIPKTPEDPSFRKLDATLEQMQVPKDWCRYMSVDPGHTVCAVLFAAVPPPEFGDHVVIFDELYLRNCSAQMFADKVAEKIGTDSYRAFIIDEHGSRVTQAGAGVTIKYQYMEALKNKRISSEITGHGFIPGSDDRAGRSTKVREWLTIRHDGHTKLRVMHNKAPNFLREIARYKKRITKEGPTDVSLPNSKWSHLMNTTEYLAAYNPKYHKPRPPGRIKSWAENYLAEKKRRKQQRDSRDGNDAIVLGPASSR